MTEPSMDMNSPAAGAGAALWRAGNIWRRRQNAALRPCGLSPVQYLLLAGIVDLSGRNGPVTQATLARHCGADAMMTSQVTRALERAGLVRRDANEADARAFALAPTAQGRKLAGRAAPAMARAEADFFAALGPDAEAFAGALQLLAGEKPRRRVPAARGI